MKKRWVTTVVFAVMALTLSTVAAAAPVAGPNAPATADANDYVMVTLPSPAAAEYTGGIGHLAGTRPERGRLDTASPAYSAYLRWLDNEHANFRASLRQTAPGAEIVREYFNVLNGFAVQLNGNPIAAVKRAEGATVVEKSWLYHLDMSQSPYLINADAVWNEVGGQADGGAGIKVGVIDSGIDDTNIFFDCKGDIQHKAYASGVALGAINPYGALVEPHGTHVAGTIAGCVTDGSIVQPMPVAGDLSGVAPGASLYDYNVFPGFGAGFWAFGGSAFSHDIAAAIEDALNDGMDVVNMSLGGGVQGPHDFLAEASNAAVDAGMAVVVAAGNSGDGDATVESPGSAAKVITAGASTNSHFGGVPVTVGEATYVAASGDFGPYGDVTSGDLVDWADATGGASTACTAAASGTDLAGDLVLIDRGACSFSTKIRNAQVAGAGAVVVANNVAGPPTSMGTDGTANQPTIVGVMVSKADGAAIRSTPLAAAAAIGGSPEEFSAEPNVLAGFSSRGPTPFTYLVKPDVVAPGVNIYSSVFDNQFAFYQGTSMATPHVTGSVALLMQAHPDWDVTQVKSALVNTANDAVLTGLPAGQATPLQIGGGLVDLAAATSTSTFLSAQSVSFGLWNGNKAANSAVDLTVATEAGSCDVSLDGDAGGMVTLGSSTVADGGTITVSLNGGKADQIASGDYWGNVVVACENGDSLHAPWWVRVDRKSKP